MIVITHLHYREYKRGRPTLINRLHSHLLANAGWWYMPPLNNDDNGEGHRLLLTLDFVYWYSIIQWFYLSLDV